MLTTAELNGLFAYAKDKGLRPVYICYRGSISHNLYVPPTDPDCTDDVDVFMVTMADVNDYVGILQFKDSRSEFISGRVDLEQHDIRKFLHLCNGSNPNVIQSLHVPDHHVIFVSPEFDRIILRNRRAFGSKLLYHTFTGYAMNQLRKLTEGAYKGYMGEKRKALVDKFGYDTKNASHLIRLLTMAKEFFQTNGTLVVERTHDRDFLLSIKRGEFTLDEVMTIAVGLSAEVTEAYTKSTLPDRPDVNIINAMCQSMILSGGI